MVIPYTLRRDLARYHGLLVFLLFAGLAVGLYFQVLQNAHFFFCDDKTTLQFNPAIREPFNLKQLWAAFNTRVVTGFSFALNYAAHQTNVFGYRVVNLFLHVANALTFYLLACQLLKRSNQISTNRLRSRRWIAWLAAVIFLVHPVATEPVNYLTQRYVLLAAFCYLLAVYVYVRGRSEGKPRYLRGALLLTVVAMFCKEISITLPLMLLACEVFFFSNKRESAWQRARVLFPFLLTLLIIPLTLTQTSVGAIGTARIAQISESSESNQAYAIDISRAGNTQLSRTEYFLTELRVLRTYLRLFLWPVNQVVDYDYPLHSSQQWPAVGWSVVVLLVLVGVGIACFTRWRIVAFLVLWFFLTLALESSVIPIGHVIAEYRMYLALAGLALGSSVLLSDVLRHPVARRAFFVGVVLFLGSLTLKRNDLWRDEVRLWEDNVIRSAKISTRNNWGVALLEQGRWQEAIVPFEQCLRQDERYENAYINLCLAYSGARAWEQAVPWCEQALPFNPDSPKYRHQLGFVYAKLGRDEDALAQYGHLLQLAPSASRAGDYAKLTLRLHAARPDEALARERIALLRAVGETQVAAELEQYLVRLKVKQ